MSRLVLTIKTIRGAGQNPVFLSIGGQVVGQIHFGLNGRQIKAVFEGFEGIKIDRIDPRSENERSLAQRKRLSRLSSIELGESSELRQDSDDD